MHKKSISSGVVHTVPKDLKAKLVDDKSVLERWEDITPLARNEWICWVEDAKQEKTRVKRIVRTTEELLERKKRAQ